MVETEATPEQVEGWQRSYNRPGSLLSPSEQRSVQSMRVTQELHEALRTRRTRRGIPLEEIRRAARVYLNDTTGAPTKAVSEALGKDGKPLPLRTASNRVRKARDLDLIPPDGASPEEMRRARVAINAPTKAVKGVVPNMSIDELRKRLRPDRAEGGKQ
jgi:hypothetical protein